MGHRRNQGFTLLETMVAVGIAAVLLGAATIPQALASSRSMQSAMLLSQIVTEARGLAESTEGGGSGAILVLNGAGTTTVSRFLRNRPIVGRNAPMPAGIPPAVLPVPVSLGPNGRRAFTLLFAPDGHLDVYQGTVSAGSAPMAAAPGCGDGSVGATISLTVGEAATAHRLVLDCTSGTSSAD